MRSGAQARVEHRPAGGGERTRTVQHRGDAFKLRGCNRGVAEIEYTPFTGQFGRERLDGIGMAAGENWTQVAICRKAGGEPASVPVGAVDHPRSAHASSDDGRSGAVPERLNPTRKRACGGMWARKTNAARRTSDRGRR